MAAEAVRAVTKAVAKTVSEAMASSAAFSHTITTIPRFPMAWPDSTKPRAKAAEPHPRSQP
jgi:hypothetical protein